MRYNLLHVWLTIISSRRQNIKKWTEKEDLIAVYLYRFQKTDAEVVSFFAKQMGRGHDSSLKMRIANVKYVTTDSKGFSNYAQQTKKVYDRYKDKTIADIEKELKNNGIKIS